MTRDRSCFDKAVEMTTSEFPITLANSSNAMNNEYDTFSRVPLLPRIQKLIYWSFSSTIGCVGDAGNVELFIEEYAPGKFFLLFKIFFKDTFSLFINTLYIKLKLIVLEIAPSYFHAFPSYFYNKTKTSMQMR